jgi:hypothetical protein
MLPRTESVPYIYGDAANAAKLAAVVLLASVCRQLAAQAADAGKQPRTAHQAVCGARRWR